MRQSKAEIVHKLKSMDLCGNITLEPRLQEYLKKRIYYKEHKELEPCISLEREFLITSNDKRILKAFISGEENIYDNKRYDQFARERQFKQKQYFPSKEFRTDDRVPDTSKLNPDKTQPINRGMFVPESNGGYYEDNNIPNYNIISSRDFPPYVYNGEGYDINESKFNPRIDPEIYEGIDLHDKTKSQYHIPLNPWKDKKNHVKENKLDTYQDPRNNYIINDLLSRAKCIKEEINQQNLNYCNFDSQNPYDCRLSTGCDNGPMTRYGNDPLPPTYNLSSEMDTDNKVVIPNMASNSKREISTGNYRFEDYYGKQVTRDSALESELLRGMPTSRTHNRSYGYRNPEDHYFEFLDNTFEQHTEPFERSGEATRLQNKLIAKNRTYTREIM